MIEQLAVTVALATGPDPLQAALAYRTHLAAVVVEQEELAAERAAAAAARQAQAGQATRSYRSPVNTGLNWAALRDCESGGDYTIDTGNGYYGAYQFSASTWAAMGGTGLPSQASPAEQDMRAQRLYDAAGAGPWPVCGQLL